jgi:hypothetical protein
MRNKVFVVIFLVVLLLGGLIWLAVLQLGESEKNEGIKTFPLVAVPSKKFLPQSSPVTKKKEVPPTVLKSSSADEILGKKSPSKEILEIRSQVESPGEESSKRAEPFSLKRNPFLTQAEEILFARRGDREVIDYLDISAIFYSPPNSYAIVNGRVTKENDIIDGKEVKKIEQEAIILKDGQREYIIYLK